MEQGRIEFNYGINPWTYPNVPTTVNGYVSYWQRVCPTCNGTGINPVANYLICPKCNGEKVVPQK